MCDRQQFLRPRQDRPCRDRRGHSRPSWPYSNATRGLIGYSHELTASRLQFRGRVVSNAGRPGTGAIPGTAVAASVLVVASAVGVSPGRFGFRPRQVRLRQVRLRHRRRRRHRLAAGVSGLELCLAFGQGGGLRIFGWEVGERKDAGGLQLFGRGRVARSRPGSSAPAARSGAPRFSRAHRDSERVSAGIKSAGSCGAWSIRRVSGRRGGGNRLAAAGLGGGVVTVPGWRSRHQHNGLAPWRGTGAVPCFRLRAGRRGAVGLRIRAREVGAREDEGHRAGRLGTPSVPRSRALVVVSVMLPVAGCGFSAYADWEAFEARSSQLDAALPYGSPIPVPLSVSHCGTPSK
jgi:hypothetical protein